MKDFSKEPVILGIIGAGIMGRGIAQIAVTAGVDVILMDMNISVCEDAAGFINKMLDRLAEKGSMSDTDVQQAKDRLTITTSIQDLALTDVVVEAVIEKLEVKQSIFKQLEDIVSSECILATNTSSLSVTAIGAGRIKPERLAGFHFFNPVPLMKLVEVIKGVRTSDTVVEQLFALATRFGHSPVMVADSPGFLVNHSGRGLVTEGLRIIYESIADIFSIDAVMRDCAGFRMGPFELMDLTGLDVTFPTTDQIYQQYFQEPRLRPTPLQQRRFTAGLYGRKTGEGFYRYQNGEKLLPEVNKKAAVKVESEFWISHQCKPDLREKVVSLLEQANCKINTTENPVQGNIAIVLPLGLDISTATYNEGLDPAYTVGIDSLFNMGKRIVLMSSPATQKRIIDETRTMLENANREVTVIRDSAGFITQRVIATIINIACDIAQQGIARPEDIDKGVKLGLGYPEGPLALGDKLGSGRILNILENMQSCYGDMRYRPSPWLRRRSQLGLSLLHRE
jgi:3-hydroxybutyryl-CoA dehydrogenase